MRGIGKALRRTPAVRPGDRNGGLPRLSGSVPHVSRCPASPRHALLAENLGRPSLWVNIKDLWYKYQMEQQGLAPKDLVPYIGNRDRVYEVLNRKRPLTLKMVWRLHRGLGIPAESLIKVSEEQAP